MPAPTAVRWTVCRRLSSPALAAHRQQRFDAALLHGYDRFDRIDARLSRRAERENPFETVEKVLRGQFRDPHGPVTLYIGVAPHWTRPCAWTADVAPQQEQIDDRLDGFHTANVLGQTHGPGADDGVGLHVNGCGAFNVSLADARLGNDPVPAFRFDIGD